MPGRARRWWRRARTVPRRPEAPHRRQGRQARSAGVADPTRHSQWRRHARGNAAAFAVDRGPDWRAAVGQRGPDGHAHDRHVSRNADPVCQGDGCAQAGEAPWADGDGDEVQPSPMCPEQGLDQRGKRGEIALDTFDQRVIFHDPGATGRRRGVERQDADHSAKAGGRRRRIRGGAHVGRLRPDRHGRDRRGNCYASPRRRRIRDRPPHCRSRTSGRNPDRPRVQP